MKSLKPVEITQSLIISEETVNDIVSYLPEHENMLKEIAKNYPEMKRATSLFNKTQSQFMDNMLTVSHPTPIRNLRQILAEVEKSRLALQESYFKNAKKLIEIKMKEELYNNENNKLKREYIIVEINELESQINSSKSYISGAIRKITNYTEQYKSIINSMGVTDFNEIDFEKEEERYHIMKAFDQALTAARTRNGVIDEGNHIYLNQIGINGASAQRHLRNYMAKEGIILHEYEQEIANKKIELIKTYGELLGTKMSMDIESSMPEPTHNMVLEFLNKMADKYSNCSKVLAKSKGMSNIITKHAALAKGDTRLLGNK